MKHYAFCSFGKDSVATVLTAIKYGEPLDGVIYCETMYDNKRGISAEQPEHAEWIYNVAKPKMEKMGVRVIITRSKWDMLSLFHRKLTRGRRIGMTYGYPLRGHCYVEKYCKLMEARRIRKELGDFVEYVGIASDESERLSRMNGNKVSLLAKYGITESMAKRICKDAGLLSPTYDYTHRGGCWFCPSATINEYRHFSDACPELWKEVLSLEDTPNIVGRSLRQSIPNSELIRRVNTGTYTPEHFEISETDEIWVDVEGTSGRYKISDKGRIYSVSKQIIVAQTPLPNGKHSVVFVVDKKQTRRHAEDVFARHFPELTDTQESAKKKNG